MKGLGGAARPRGGTASHTLRGPGQDGETRVRVRVRKALRCEDKGQAPHLLGARPSMSQVPSEEGATIILFPQNRKWRHRRIAEQQTGPRRYLNLPSCWGGDFGSSGARERQVLLWVDCLPPHPCLLTPAVSVVWSAQRILGVGSACQQGLAVFSWDDESAGGLGWALKA